MYISPTRFRCDACGVISKSTKGWTLIEARRTDGSRDGKTITHLCVACRPRLRDLLALAQARRRDMSARHALTATRARHRQPRPARAAMITEVPSPAMAGQPRSNDSATPLTGSSRHTSDISSAVRAVWVPGRRDSKGIRQSRRAVAVRSGDTTPSRYLGAALPPLQHPAACLLAERSARAVQSRG